MQSGLEFIARLRFGEVDLQAGLSEVGPHKRHVGRVILEMQYVDRLFHGSAFLSPINV
ncbi:MAG: hypothetical protein P8010_16065 [Desulfosarcinaceae bacterium]